MGRRTTHITVLLLCAALSGCGMLHRRPTPPTTQPPSTTPISYDEPLDRNLVAIATGSGREPALPDPATMIPPRPIINIPSIPDAPPKDDRLVEAPKDTLPTPEVKQAAVKTIEAEQPKAESQQEALLRLRQTARSQYGKLEGFTAKLTRRETVANQPRGEEVLQYKFRTNPYSMHLKWIGREAQGRELIYVAGTREDKVHILTARGDGSLLMPAGKRFSFAPTASEIRSQARYDIREGGLGLSVVQFGKVVDLIEKDPSQAKRLRYLGKQQRPERTTPLELVEETIPPNSEPLLPRGGKRMTYFDADPASPSFGLPILVMTYTDGREVEYYHFDQLKPAQFTDADFDPNRLWRK